MEFVMPHSIRIVIITEAVIHLWACTGTRVETSMGVVIGHTPVHPWVPGRIPVRQWSNSLTKDP